MCSSLNLLWIASLSASVAVAKTSSIEKFEVTMNLLGLMCAEAPFISATNPYLSAHCLRNPFIHSPSLTTTSSRTTTSSNWYPSHHLFLGFLKAPGNSVYTLEVFPHQPYPKAIDLPRVNLHQGLLWVGQLNESNLIRL